MEIIGYEKVGTGSELVIVLPDWMSTHHSFDDIKKYLNTDKFTYIFADNRGYGLSKNISGSYTAEEAASDVMNLAVSLDCSKFHFIGHSMSGIIGQRLSLDFPEHLKSLVLVTPVTAASMELDEQGASLFGGSITDDELWTTVACAVTSNRLNEKFYKLKLQHHRDQVDTAAFSGFLEMCVSTNFSEKMQNLKTPTLVISGEHDFPAFSKENYINSIGKWYNSVTIEEFANSGHYPMSETPPYFVRVVEDYLTIYSS